MSKEDVQETTDTTATTEGNEPEVVETKKTLDQLSQEELVDYVKTLRKENASHRTAKQAKDKELEEFKAWKESQKSDLQKAQERATDLEKQNYSLLRQSIALSAGLTPEDVEFVSGDTEDEMKASAEKLAARVKGSVEEKPRRTTDVFAGARGTPVNGTKDTKALANEWLAGLVFKD